MNIDPRHVGGYPLAWRFYFAQHFHALQFSLIEACQSAVIPLAVHGRMAATGDPAMRDEWTKKLPDGRTVVYTSEFLVGNGGVITAELDEIVFNHAVPGQMTREEVEARFAGLSSQPLTHRHSRRLYIHVRVRLHWRLEDQSLISEETETVVVNAHGALVRLEAVPLLSQKVTLENISTHETQDAIVVFLGKAAAKSGKISVGVQFTKSNPSFWHVSFPPEDWSPAHPDAKA